MKGLNTRLLTAMLCIVLTVPACKKYLDEKSDQRLATPGTLPEIQAILDNYGTINRAMYSTNSFADEYYFNFQDWQALQQSYQPYSDTYIWHPQTLILEGGPDDWIYQYTAIFYINTALDNLQKISKEKQPETWDYLKGQALFKRAHAFFDLAQSYAPQHDGTSASTDLGLVLRLNSDFNKKSTRATVQETYNQIIKDLEEAFQLIPANQLPATKENKIRPTKTAAAGLLSRVYLQIGDYVKAKQYADACLSIYNNLLDYNLISNSSTPFTLFNSEVIYYTNYNGSLNARDYSGTRIDSNLYISFDSNDLRKLLFFEGYGDGTYYFKGSYNESIYDMFNGIAVDEIYLIKAECLARAGDLTEAMNVLNSLLKKRWVTGTYIDLTANDSIDAIKKIINERRKQLLNRGRRWSDLRRLNKDPQFAVTLKRDLNGQIYTLPPNDLRYTMLIPLQVIAASGIQQNPR